jgi:hypothetical protein
MDLTQLCNLTGKSVKHYSHNYEIWLSNIIKEKGIINILKLFKFCEFLNIMLLHVAVDILNLYLFCQSSTLIFGIVFPLMIEPLRNMSSDIRYL